MYARPATRLRVYFFIQRASCAYALARVGNGVKKKSREKMLDGKTESYDLERDLDFYYVRRLSWC